MVSHIEIQLQAKPRGFHLITNEIEEKLGKLPKDGILNLFIRHTSAGLTINENCDASVRSDFSAFFSRLVPENETYFTHTAEGPDDMPAHIKASLMGSSVSIPIKDGTLHMGTWQGIYLCEFRNSGGSRKLTATIIS